MRRGLTSVLAVLTATAFTATARAELVDDNPAATSRAPGQVSVFIRGADGALLTSPTSRRGVRSRRGSSLGRLPGLGPRRRPAATARQLGRVRARRRPGVLYQKYVGHRERDWSGCGPPRPRDAVRTRGLGAPRQRHHRPLLARHGQRPRGGSPWVPSQAGPTVNNTQLDPMATTAAPAVVSRNTGYVDVIVRGTDDGVYVNTFQRLGLGRLGPDPRRDGRPSPRRRPPCAPSTRWRSSCARCDGRGPLGHMGRRRLVGLEDGPGRGSTPASPPSPTRRSASGCSRAAVPRWSTTSTTPASGPENGWNGWRLLHPPPAPPAASAASAVRPRSGPRDRPREARPLRRAAAARRPGAPHRRRAAGVGGGSSSSPATGGWDAQTATSGPDGRYLDAAPGRPDPQAGTCRRWAPGASSTLACASATIVRARAGVTLKASERVRPGGTVRFHGRLKGRPVPGRGKLVELQAHDGGKWRTFAQPRSRRDGRYRRRVPAAPHLRPADVPLPRPRPARDRLSVRARVLAAGRRARSLARASRAGR